MDKIGSLNIIRAAATYFTDGDDVDRFSDSEDGDALTREQHEDVQQLCLTVQYLIPMPMPVAISSRSDAVRRQQEPFSEFTFKHNEINSYEKNALQRLQRRILSPLKNAQLPKQPTALPFSNNEFKTIKEKTVAVFDVKETKRGGNGERVKKGNQYFSEGISRMSQHFPEEINRMNRHVQEGINTASKPFPEEVSKMNQHFSEEVSKMNQHFPEGINTKSQHFPEEISKMNQHFLEEANGTNKPVLEKVESKSLHILRAAIPAHFGLRTEQKVAQTSPKTLIPKNDHRDVKKLGAAMENAELTLPFNMDAKNKESRVIFEPKNASNQARTSLRRLGISRQIQNEPTTIVRKEGDKTTRTDLVYNFKSWGDKHAVHISRQPDQSTTHLLLQPTSSLVEQRLHDHAYHRNETWAEGLRQDQEKDEKHWLWIEKDEEE